MNDDNGDVATFSGLPLPRSFMAFGMADLRHFSRLAMSEALHVSHPAATE